ncbi:MAG TPA: hypothetical protein VFQ61_36245, partial [Polyangiaceae bacterium]|nr:hypothetical protein [Polyangiaceae bacterium]
DAPAPNLASRTLELLCVGGASWFLLPLAWALERGLGLDRAELAIGFLMFHGAHVINDPHFAVTYVLFYRGWKRRWSGGELGLLDRVRHVFAGVLVPLLLAGWIGFALVTGSAPALGALIQGMFLLVGWHYVKQGYGVLSVLSARRGRSFSAGERRILLAHCFASWAYAWASPPDAGTILEEKGVVYTSFAHSASLERCAGVVLALSTLALIACLIRKWRSERRTPPLGPLAVFLTTVWLWTIASSIDPLLIYMIPALHSIQYLYFVGLMRWNQARAHEGAPHFGPTARSRLLGLFLGAVALGYVLFHGLPELLDGAIFRPSLRHPRPLTDLGTTPFFAAFFTFVNIHHYFMDNVIWRRSNPETRFLSR